MHHRLVQRLSNYLITSSVALNQEKEYSYQTRWQIPRQKTNTGLDKTDNTSNHKHILNFVIARPVIVA